MMPNISVTSYAPLFKEVKTPLPEGMAGVYQLGTAFQLEAGKFGMFLNIRQDHAGGNDVEIGCDIAIINDPVERKVEQVMPVSRCRVDKLDDDEQFYRILPYPLGGNFFPLEAASPCAGRGYAISHLMARPCHPDGKVSGTTATVKSVGRFEILQFSYTSANGIAVERRKIFDPCEVLPGWRIIGGGMGRPLHSGDGFISTVTAVPADVRPRISKEGYVHWTKSRAGVMHWKFVNDGFYPVKFTPVAPVISSEGSIIRADDGSIFFTMRVAGHIPAEGDREIADEISRSNDVRIWRSCDEGNTWELFMDVPGNVAAGPRSLGKTPSGQIFLLGNTITGGRDRDNAPQHLMRSELSLFPIDIVNRKVLPWTPVRQPMLDHGDNLPAGCCWLVDHPYNSNIIDSNGRVHCLVSFRMLSSLEIEGLQPASAPTGCYLEEITENN